MDPLGLGRISKISCAGFLGGKQLDDCQTMEPVRRNGKGLPSLETLALSTFQRHQNGGRGGNRTPDTGIFKADLKLLFI